MFWCQQEVLINLNGHSVDSPFVTHREIGVLLPELVELRDLLLELGPLLLGDEDAAVLVALVVQLATQRVHLGLHLLQDKTETQ